MKKEYILEYEHYIKRMPYSEAMMHMKLAGTKCRISFQGTSVKVFPDINKGNYVTVTPGEAGLYWDDEANQYYYTQED